LAAQAFMALPSHILFGWLGDKVKKPKLMAGCMLSALASMILLGVVQTEWAILLFTALFSAVESTFPVNWSTVGEYFGRKNFAKIRGSMSFVSSWGSVIGPVAAGLVYDRTESYELLIWSSAALLLVASALFIAAVLAAIMAPLHVRMAARLRGRPRLAAGILVLAVVVVLLGPLVGLAAFLLKEGNEALKFVAAAVGSDSVARLVAKLPDSLERIVGHALARLQDVDRMVEGQLSAQGGKAAAAVWGALSATGSVVFAAAMMLIALFFFLVQGGELVSWLDETSPLRPGQTLRQRERHVRIEAKRDLLA
jgi:MFS family permease